MTCLLLPQMRVRLAPHPEIPLQYICLPPNSQVALSVTRRGLIIIQALGQGGAKVQVEVQDRITLLGTKRSVLTIGRKSVL